MTQTYPLATDYGTYLQREDQLSAANLALLPGDTVNLFLRFERVLAVTRENKGNGVAVEKTNKFKAWTRFRSDTELRRLVGERYPGLGFQGFEILGRGVSGRVGKIRIDGDEGKTVEVKGLAVRWTLDVPDTLFTAKRLTPPERAPGWLFTGRGWGHGVGMCQIGAFGMAQRGHTYRDILLHYYSGVEIVRTSSLEGLPKPAAP